MPNHDLPVPIDQYGNPIEIKPDDLLGSDPAGRLAMAKQIAGLLAPVVHERGLASNIQGKEYVRFEGWTLLGSLLGVFPVTEWVHEIERGYEARVVARTLGGQIVGAAHARCTRDERNWSSRDDFALASMAQTRAGAKALRMPLGFVMQLAGYEATPEEEIDTRPETSSRERSGGDLARYAGGGATSKNPVPQTAPLATSLATEKQRKLLWAKARTKSEKLGVPYETMEAELKKIVRDLGVETTRDLPRASIDVILTIIDGWSLATFGEKEPPATQIESGDASEVF